MQEYSFCNNQIFQFNGGLPSFIIIFLLHGSLLLIVLALMCRLCSKAFSYSNFHIHEAYKFYTLAFLSTILVILTRICQLTLKQIKRQNQLQYSGWALLTQIVGSCSLFAMNQTYTQNGFTWLMIGLGCDFTTANSSISQNIVEIDQNVLMKRKRARLAKTITLYAIMPTFAFTSVIFALLTDPWCTIADVMIMISGMISMIVFCFPLGILIKDRYNDPLTSKYTKICWVYMIGSVILRQSYYLFLLIMSFNDVGSKIPEFLNNDIFSVGYVIICSCMPLVCMIYLAENQLQRQKCSWSSAMLFANSSLL